MAVVAIMRTGSAKRPGSVLTFTQHSGRVRALVTSSVSKCKEQAPQRVCRDQGAPSTGSCPERVSVMLEAAHGQRVRHWEMGDGGPSC